MASNSPILAELRDLVNQIGNECSSPQCNVPSPSGPCSNPCNFPFAQVTMTCPPPILAPTRPAPVKPLKLPCYEREEPLLTPEQAEEMRYDNFYNNYNMDFRYREEPRDFECPPCTPEKQNGQTFDGKSPCCDEKCHKKKNKSCPVPGCPTGFKPCTMKLTPPPCCDPNGVWFAEVQPCPPKRPKGPKLAPGAASCKKCNK